MTASKRQGHTSVILNMEPTASSSELENYNSMKEKFNFKNINDSEVFGVEFKNPSFSSNYNGKPSNPGRFSAIGFDFGDNGTYILTSNKGPHLANGCTFSTGGKRISYNKGVRTTEIFFDPEKLEDAASKFYNFIDKDLSKNGYTLK